VVSLHVHLNSHPAELVELVGIVGWGVSWRYHDEEEEEDLFVFNDTIEGPRAPVVKPGRVTQV